MRPILSKDCDKIISTMATCLFRTDLQLASPKLTGPRFKATSLERMSRLTKHVQFVNLEKVSEQYLRETSIY